MAKRMNSEWIIIMGVKLPTRYGEPECEIVIGDRGTEFEPYVAWHCFEGDSYCWGHYCGNILGAIREAKDKIRNELHCSAEYADWYWRTFSADWREEE